jgi:uncharacterized membrane protein
MKLKLKEDPKEWRKFAMLWSVVFPLVFWLLWRKGLAPAPIAWAVTAVGVAAILGSVIAPQLFRGVYRAGMTGSFFVGQFMGKILLSIIFWGVVFPMSLLLRLLGKDLLELKKNTAKTSYWKNAKRTGAFEQQF